MFGNFRERLHMVQQDFTTSFRTLGDKSRDAKIKEQPRFEERLPHFIGGPEILNRYEECWFLLHKQTKDCAQAAETVDGDVVMLSAHWERRRTNLTHLQDELQNLPALTTELDTITANIALLEGDFEEMESRLTYLEMLCCQCEQETSKQHHINQLQAYKKKKRAEIEALEVELNSQHAQKVAQLEQAMQQKLRERQRVYEEAFNQDMKQYISTGYLQHREPSEADVCALDQMSVTNILDQEALDDFLNSSDNEIITGSSLTSVPDVEPCFSESLRRTMNQTVPANSQALVQVEDVSSEESIEPLVQSDEEDIQPDMFLVNTQDIGIVSDST